MNQPIRLTQRQYQTPDRELARQLQERDRELFAQLRTLGVGLLTSVGSRLSSHLFFPEDYGAKRDGVTDDGAAIRRTIDAAKAVGGTVMFSSGTYLHTGCFVVDAPVRFAGPTSAIIRTASTNISQFLVNDTEDVWFEGFTIRGNQTGHGGVAPSTAGGHGIVLYSSERTVIVGMMFESIGVPVASSIPGDYASPVAGVSSSFSHFERNYFASSCHNRTGADMAVIGLGNKFVFNTSESDCDAHINTGGGGTGSCIIGNWAKRLPGTTARSGVIAEYGEHTTDGRVIGNYMEGFPWHGYYATHTFSYPGLETYGGLTFSDNVAIYCGGGRTGDSSFNTGSFHLHGRRGLNGSGNRSLFDGYDSTMTPRGVLTSAGILFQDDVANLALTDTIIRQPYQHGVLFRALNTGALLENVQFVNLHVIDCATSHGIYLNAQTTATECIRNIKVHTGRVTTMTAGASAVKCDNNNGAWFNNVTFDNVDMVYNGASASAAAAFDWAGYSDYTRNTGRISSCLSRNFSTGLACAYTVNLFVPFALRFIDNRIENATLGLTLGSGTVYWGLHEGTVGASVTTMNPSRTRTGRILGPAGAGRVPVEIVQLNLINAVPPDGAWIVGDRVYMANKAGPIVGYECIVAGSIGTWRAIYNYGQGGSVLTCTAKPIVNSTTVTTDGMLAWTATGTPAAVAYANTNRYTRTTRLEIAAASSATAVAGYQNADLAWLLNTGFYVRFHWGIAAGATITTSRAFCGLVNSTAAPTDVEPSSLLNMIGMGWDAADTNVQIMRNDGSGTATKVDLGASYPVPTTDATQVYMLEMVSMGSGTGIQWAVTNETTGSSVRGSFSTDVPNGGTTPLAPQLWTSVGGTTGIPSIAFAGFYGERGY